MIRLSDNNSRTRAQPHTQHPVPATLPGAPSARAHHPHTRAVGEAGRKVPGCSPAPHSHGAKAQSQSLQAVSVGDGDGGHGGGGGRGESPRQRCLDSKHHWR